MKSFRLPWLPLSALLFYLIVLAFWQIGILPSPAGIINFLESLYNSYGLIGLFIASFLEGIVYIGLYFPGTFIVLLAVFLSDGKFSSLLNISLVVAMALTVTSIINYIIGRSIKTNENIDRTFKKKGLLLSMILPIFLAFYFFNSGIKRHSPLKLIFVPLIMVPYGLILAHIFYPFRESLRQAIETPIITISIIIAWILIATMINYKNNKKAIVQIP